MQGATTTKSKKGAKKTTMPQKTADTTTQKPVLTVPDTARFLGVSTSLVWKMIRSGRMQPLRLGDRILFNRAYLERFIEGQ